MYSISIMCICIHCSSNYENVFMCDTCMSSYRTQQSYSLELSDGRTGFYAICILSLSYLLKAQTVIEIRMTADLKKGTSTRYL